MCRSSHAALRNRPSTRTSGELPSRALTRSSKLDHQCSGTIAPFRQKRTANCPIDRGNRRRMIRGAELVIRRPRPPRLAPTDEEEAAQRVAISPTGRVNADALTKKCVDELGDDSAIPTPSETLVIHLVTLGFATRNYAG